jgi:hypothetical protein
MADETPPDAIDRIDRAIARIEQAVAHRDRASAALTRRHDALRARMTEAVDALDDLITREHGD